MAGGPDMDAIERRAEELLGALEDYVWDRSRLPVPIDDIADTHFGLHVREVTPAEMASAPGCPELEPGHSLSGLLLPAWGEIWVNRDEAARWPGRRRFTIAHELGHHVLHNTGQQSLFCRRGTVDPQSEEVHEQAPDIEREANAFGAAMCMPAELMRRHYERLAESEDRFAALCELFASSKAAMGRRLHAVI